MSDTTGSVQIGGRVSPIRVTVERIERTTAGEINWFSKMDRRRWLVQAFDRAGWQWIAEYLPLRFNRGYATNRLGYRLGGKVPFFDTGLMAKVALSKAHATGMMDRNIGPKVVIRIPTPEYVNKNAAVIAAFRVVPESEVRWFAKMIERELKVGLAMATHKTATRGPTAGQTTTRLGTNKSTAWDADRATALRGNLNGTLKLRSRNLRSFVHARVQSNQTPFADKPTTPAA